MRFDDSLKTVLAADASTPFGAQAAFRQIADLAARGRIEETPELLARLRELRERVPLAVRAAAARALALATPSAGLVAVFAEDDQSVAAPVLRAARLDDANWCALLPSLGPTGRAILRHRDDLSEAVIRALESFGPADFALGHDRAEAEPVEAAPAEVIEEHPVVSSAPPPQPAPLAAVLGIEPATAPGGGFQIAALVDRIAAFRQLHGEHPVATAEPVEPRAAEPAAAAPIERFGFETDASGVIRWVDAAPRAAVIGIGFLTPGGDGRPHVDGVASGAFRHRTAFNDARLSIAGRSALAGDWRISGVPMFDPASGRFVGFRGAARRPRVDEGAIGRRADNGGVEGLRRLVHELRSPTNAIAGFSELIETAMLGPVPDVYRQRAAAIRTQAADLVGAIEDLELAARIEGDALDLHEGAVALAPLLARTLDELAPLMRLRGCTVDLAPVPPALALACDERIAERLVGRLVAALIASAADGERLAIDVRDEGADVAIDITRPLALATIPDTALLTLDAEREVEMPGAPLLGTGFAIRLARNLATELGGALIIDADRLTLRLPTGLIDDMGQASTN
ncbi:sensor histidine kinase [Sphingomonas sp. MMSM24]|uniref:histidine kinase n=1 Tax=Sphingomonas lycopersici TaxID=2951807 RepID=A0AA41Z7U7_9SPHN|nr:sensor histidine kinase [Sphingomonas lycopersici]MCW6535597.1 sensor histidine kinase [Sphingomonas lycopersici]